MLKSIQEALSLTIRSIINDAGFGTFFKALLNQETYEYRDLQLLLALSECFCDTTCTFHFLGIGEVTLTPYDFSVIIGLKLGGERIHVNDSLTPNEIKKLLGVVPSKMRSKNVPLSWLCENITKCDTMARGTRMFMLLYTRTFLCQDLGSTVNLCYLWSLRNIEQIKNYNWGSMAYATHFHFMTQLSKRSLSSLGRAPFVWQGKVQNFWLCVGFGKLFWLYCNGVVNFYFI